MPPQEKFDSPVHLDDGQKNNVEVCRNPVEPETRGSIRNVKEEVTDIDFDELLPYVGEFGLYQKILFILMIPFASFVAWVYFSQIFITLTPEDYWCWVPELEDLTVDERFVMSLGSLFKFYFKRGM